MTAERLLATLWSRTNVVITVDGDRLRVEAPYGMLTPSIRDTLAKLKTDLLRLMAVSEQYRQLLRSDLSDSLFRAAQERLIDELGPALATAVRQTVENGQPITLRRN